MLFQHRKRMRNIHYGHRSLYFNSEAIQIWLIWYLYLVFKIIFHNNLWTTFAFLKLLLNFSKSWTLIDVFLVLRNKRNKVMMARSILLDDLWLNDIFQSKSVFLWKIIDPNELSKFLFVSCCYSKLPSRKISQPYFNYYTTTLHSFFVQILYLTRIISTNYSIFSIVF